MAKLYVVATPIGNLGDFSPRAAETLAAVDFIAAEDTRVTAKLLNHFGIQKPMISYYEHNRREKGEYIAERILAGENCAIVTDAGTPAISDPGTDLVEICRSRGVEVASVPGPSAIITALSISGLDCGRFTFEGFLSTSKKSRTEHLESLRGERRLMVFYEAPHKLRRTLQDFYETFGDRRVVLCRELTKIHEEALDMSLSEAIRMYEEKEPRGEYVVLLTGAPAPEKKDNMELAMEEARRLIAEGETPSRAAKKAAAMCCVSKNDLYRIIAAETDEDDEN